MYDLCVIGSGWAGFNAAMRAAELNATVCLIEKDNLGGVCLNHGCIPTKVLAKSAETLSLFKKSSIFGISSTAQLQSADVLSRKKAVIEKLRNGIQFQLKSKNIEVIPGEASVKTAHEVSVGTRTIQAKHILVAIGSRPIELPAIPFDGKKVLSSDTILELDTIPQALLVVGGGVIGCEFASIFSSFGSKVTIVELTEQLLPAEDAEIAKRLTTVFKKRSINVLTKTDVKTVDMNSFDKVLVCVGRSPNTFVPGLEAIGVAATKKGITVNEFLQTPVESIFAAGDCIGGILLAHVAAYEGRCAVENIFSHKRAVDYHGVPNCVFTHPEIASVGLSEDAARRENRSFEVARFNFLASGMAHIIDETDGFIKIIIDTKTDEILGASIIGPKATELIALLAAAVRNRSTMTQIRNAIIAHPTLSEGISEAT